MPVISKKMFENRPIYSKKFSLRRINASWISSILVDFLMLSARMIVHIKNALILKYSLLLTTLVETEKP